MHINLKTLNNKIRIATKSNLQNTILAHLDTKLRRRVKYSSSLTTAAEDYPILNLLKHKRLSFNNKKAILIGLIKIGVANIQINCGNGLKKNILNYLICYADIDSDFKSYYDRKYINFIHLILDNTTKKDLTILLEQLDSEGQTLLAKAVEINNFYLACLFLGKGADASASMWDIKEYIKRLEDNKNKDQEDYSILIKLKRRTLVSLIAEAIYHKNAQIIYLLINAQGSKILDNDMILLSDNANIIKDLPSKEKQQLITILLSNYRQTLNSKDFKEVCYKFYMYCTTKELLALQAEISIPEAKELINQFIEYHQDRSKQLISLLKNKTPNKASIKSLLNQGVWINYQAYPFFNTPLHQASSINGNIEILSLLLEHGAVVNAQNILNKTAIYAASGTGDIHMVKKLIDKGAKVNNTASLEQQPIYNAVRQGNLIIAQLLLEQENNLDARTENGESILHVVINESRLNMLEYFVSKGARLDVVDNKGMSLQHIAVNKGDINILEYLVNKGASLDVVDNKGMSLQHIAVNKGDLNMLEYLVSKGARLDVVDNMGATLLHAASQQNNIAIVTHLIKELKKEKTLEINVIDNMGMTPLYYTITSKNKDVSQVLIDNGASLNHRNHLGFTPLHYAVLFLSEDIVQQCLKEGSNINAEDNRGKTALDLVKTSNLRSDNRDLVIQMLETAKTLTLPATEVNNPLVDSSITKEENKKIAK